MQRQVTAIEGLQEHSYGFDDSSRAPSLIRTLPYKMPAPATDSLPLSPFPRRHSREDV